MFVNHNIDIGIRKLGVIMKITRNRLLNGKGKKNELISNFLEFKTITFFSIQHIENPFICV